MTQNYELIVKGIRNFDNEVKVILTLKDKERFASVFDLHIDIERQEGAALEFYEAEAKKQAKKFLMNVAAGVCEGDELSPEKRPIILKAQKVWITYKGKLPGGITGSLKTPPTALQSEKDDIESRIEKLWMLMPSEDEKKRRDEQFAAFYDYCIEVTRRNFVKIFEESKSLQ